MSMFTFLLSALISFNASQVHVTSKDMNLVSPKDISFRIKNQPVQDELFTLYETSPATKIGFGGARGGTKSHTADSLMIFRRLKYAKTNGLLVMKLLDDIKDIHIRPMIQRYPILDNWYNKQDKLITFPNGSFFRFMSFDNFKELKQRAGRGFADIIIDQSEQFPQDELEFLATINRHVPVDDGKPLPPNAPQITPKMLFCFNPGGISHSYHKRIFVEKNFEFNERPDDFAFLQTFGWDNAYWCMEALAHDGFTISDFNHWDNETRFKYFIEKSQYGRKLNQLPDSQRQAQLLGSFDVFEGQFFSNFRRSFHVIKYTPRKEFHTRGGLDTGNTSVLEIAQRDFEGHIVACGEVYMTKENYEGPTARATAISEYLLDHKFYNLIILIDTDATITQVSNIDTNITPIEIYRKVFQELMKDKAPSLVVVNKTSLDSKKDYRHSINESIMDALVIRERAMPGGKVQRYSNLSISEDCPWLIRAFTELIHPENKILANGFDYDNNHPMRHQFDGFKYAYQGLFLPTIRKADIPPRNMAEAAQKYIFDGIEKEFNRRYKIPKS
jgi:Phage terminase large subunit